MINLDNTYQKMFEELKYIFFKYGKGQKKKGIENIPFSFPPITMKDFRPECNQPLTLMIEKITFLKEMEVGKGKQGT